MTQQLTDSSGYSVTLAREIGRGGEGTVFDIQGDLSRVAKVLHPNRRERERIRKLQAMIMIEAKLTIRGMPILAWPDEILYEGNNVVGYRMPKAENTDPLFDYLTPRRRQDIRVNVGLSDLCQLAQRIARILERLHQNKCYVGDVNSQNILVRRGNLVPIIIDCDSFQIQNPATPNRPFMSEVGMLEYQPPERKVMNQPIDASTDAFGLAVIIYQLLHDGLHPFMGIDDRNERNPPGGIAERIKAHRFAHHVNKRWKPRPNAQVSWNFLPRLMRMALIQSLDYRKHEDNRTSAGEMVEALEHMIRKTKASPTP